MSRKIILQIPVILVLGLVAGTLVLAAWLVMLIPFLIKPAFTKPITSFMQAQFAKQMVGFMRAGRKNQNGNSGRLRMEQTDRSSA